MRLQSTEFINQEKRKINYCTLVIMMIVRNLLTLVQQLVKVVLKECCREIHWSLVFKVCILNKHKKIYGYKALILFFFNYEDYLQHTR